MKKQYSSPEMEVVIMEVEQQMLAGSNLPFDSSDENGVTHGLSIDGDLLEF